MERRRAWHLALTAASVAVLVLLAREVDWPATGRVLRGASPGLLIAAVLVNLLSLAAKGARWWVFLRPLGARPLGLALRGSVVGSGLNNVLAANGGDAVRVLLVSRASGISSARVLATMVLDRVFDALGYVVMLAAAALLLVLPEPLAHWRAPALAVLAACLIPLALLARRRPATRERIAEAAPDVVQPASGSPWGVRRAAARGYGRRVVGALRDVSSAGRFTAALGLSLVAWALQVATYALAAHAAHSPLPLAGNVATVLAVSVGYFIQATPGNVGIFQLVYAVTARQFGVPSARAVAVALLIQALQVVPVTALAAVLGHGFLRRPRADAA